MNYETITILVAIASAFYGPWLLDCLIREIRIQRAHYA